MRHWLVGMLCLLVCSGCKGSPGGDEADARIDASEPDGPDATMIDARPGSPDASTVDARPGTPDARPTPDARTDCQRSGDAAQPFGNHQLPYASGIIVPSASQASKDQAVQRFYDAWKNRHLRQGCGAGRYYVEYNIDNQTVSEAHGYGMLIAVIMAGYDGNARTIFDGMVRYYQEHPSAIQRELMSWKQESCSNVEGNNSASDGDLDIAYALLLADKQWGSGGSLNYRQIAERLIGGMLAGSVDPTRGYIYLGDWAGESDGQLRRATRPSDFMPGHLASFATVGGGAWTTLLDSEYAIMDRAQRELAPGTGLFPDFLIEPLGNLDAPDGFLLEDEGDDDYEYNACRTPWRIATHAIVGGDGRAKQIANRMTSWIKGKTGGDPARIVAGYTLAGNSIGNNYTDMSFVAPFGVAAMTDRAHQAWLDALWDFIARDGGGGYYGDSIKLLSMIVMSGNWWAPEAAPCD